ncbi:MAG: hypothetical protein KDK36_00360, partial [Leptospiraceae bacterium]|nr:hypothetical protein [Leptospiraceae bacterium]
VFKKMGHIFKPIIILENPKYSGNIGMVCRIIANFGLDPLRVVENSKPKDSHLEWMAYDSKEEIEKMLTFPDIWEATKDLDLIFATTMYPGEFKEKEIPLNKIIDFSKNKKIGLVFGREDNGISKNTKQLSNYLINFNLPGYQKSMNLSNSVAYTLSLIFNSQQSDLFFENKNTRNKENFYSKAGEIFKILKMDQFKDNEYLALKRFQNILERSELTEGDIDFFYKFFREIERLESKE